MLKIYIGPNGYGKTTALHNEKDGLVKSGVLESEILFIESEILLSDELKDSKDSTRTMEFIISEILFCSPLVNVAKTAFETMVNNEIKANQSLIDSIANDSLSLNGSSIPPGTNFIEVTNNKEYKKLVTINQKVFLKNTGSGQRMNFLLRLALASKTKKYIFLDEPEKYSHPSMINETADIIRKMLANGVDVYVATHSPKLLSMLDVDFDNLFVINDSSHNLKRIDFSAAISSLSAITYANMKDKHKNYYSPTKLITNIRQIHYRDFLESLFTKKVYMCEGIDDVCFISRYLQHKDRYFEDYVIFKTFGKFNMPPFCEIYKQLGIDFTVIFDCDNNSDAIHNSVNTYLRLQPKYYQFTPSIEQEIGFNAKNDVNALNIFLDSFDFDKNTYF